MNAYTVYKVCANGSVQLLLVQDSEGVHLTVYDEHTGQTLMRMTDCSLSEFKRAIALLDHA